MMAGLVIEGFKRASAAVTEDAKALVHCCVLRSGDIQVMLAEIEQTGEYDMEASESRREWDSCQVAETLTQQQQEALRTGIW